MKLSVNFNLRATDSKPRLQAQSQHESNADLTKEIFYLNTHCSRKLETRINCRLSMPTCPHNYLDQELNLCQDICTDIMPDHLQTSGLPFPDHRCRYILTLFLFSQSPKICLHFLCELTITAHNHVYVYKGWDAPVTSVLSEGAVKGGEALHLPHPAEHCTRHMPHSYTCWWHTLRDSCSSQSGVCDKLWIFSS